MRASVVVGDASRISARPCAENALRNSAGFFRRQVDQQHAIDPGRHRLGGKAVGAGDLDRVEVTHQHHRGVVIAFAEPAHAVEHERPPRPASQRTLGTALDGRAVGHRVGERHAQLDHVGAGLDQRVHHRHGGIERGITGGDERNQGLAAPGLECGEAGVDAVHGFVQ